MLNDEIVNPEILIPNFTVFRVDRSKSDWDKGGGSCIYVHNSINASIINSFKCLDSVAVLLHVKPVPIIFICVYRSPSLTTNQSIELLSDIKAFVKSQIKDKIIIAAGDFNFPALRWNEANACGSAPNKHVQSEYLDFFAHNNFSFLLPDDTITRERLVNGVLQRSSLDQVMCSETNMLNNFKILRPLGKSDHKCITFTAQISTDISFVTQEKINWSKFSEEDMSKINRDMDWSFADSSACSVTSMWNDLHNKLMTFEKAAPRFRVKFDSSGKVVNKNPWETSRLKRLGKLCDVRWKIFDSFPTATNLNLANDAQYRYEMCINKDVKIYEAKITKHMKSNPKRFFCYLNAKRKIKDGISKVRMKDGSMAKTAEETAETLADFFESTFTTEMRILIFQSQFLTLVVLMTIQK